MSSSREFERVSLEFPVLPPSENATTGSTRPRRQRGTPVIYNEEAKFRSMGIGGGVKAVDEESETLQPQKKGKKDKVKNEAVKAQPPSSSKAELQPNNWQPVLKGEPRTEYYHKELAALSGQRPSSPPPLPPIPPGQYHPTPPGRAYPKTLPLPRYASFAPQ